MTSANQVEGTHHEAQRLARGKAPVIILTGFLGSGKTTLLNRILTADHGRRVAVVMNEFAHLGIDQHLLITAEQQIVEMNNGCICCTVRSDLIRSLFDLSAKRDMFDVVVIETTGLAEPAPVAEAVLAHERLREVFALGNVVAMVDARHIEGQLGVHQEAHRQIGFADLIIINKMDLVSDEDLERVEDKITLLNPHSAVYRAKQSEIDLELLFEHQTGSVDHKPPRPGPARHGKSEAHDHLSQLISVSVACLEPVDGLKLARWLKDLLPALAGKLLRMKGIISLFGDEDQFVIQAVQLELEARPGRPWRTGEARVSRLAFIGLELDDAELRSGFEKCAYEGGEVGISRDVFGRHLIDISPQTIDQIRYWVRQNFYYPKDVPIIVKEVPCLKVGCPPIETSIVAFVPHAPPRNFKIQAPINEVTFDLVYNLIENPLPCC